MFTRMLTMLKQFYYLGTHGISVLWEDNTPIMEYKGAKYNVPESTEIGLRRYLHRKYQKKVNDVTISCLEHWLNQPYQGDMTNLDLIKQLSM